MTIIANCLSALVLFGVGWLVLAQFDTETGRAGIYALAIAGATSAMGLYSWQSGRELASTEIRKIATYFAALASGLFLFLLVDAFVAGVNLLDPSQWHGLFRAGGPFGFILTAIAGLFALALLLATLIRALVLRALFALTGASKRTGEKPPAL